MAELAPPTLVIRHIGELLTMADREVVPEGQGRLGRIADAVLVARGATVLFVGPDAAFESLRFAPATVPPLVIEAHGQVVSPGLVDAHTHLVFAGSRAAEYHERLAGATYAQITARGGGILSTVRATRAASDDELFVLAETRLRTMRTLGTTTVEAKTGYGLDLATEDRQLHIMERLAARADLPAVIPTFLGAHAIPPEYQADRAAYVRRLREELLPRFAGRARFCDVFCDQGYFSPAEARAILTTARDQGFRLKLHANQLGDTGGAVIAAELGAISADHLDHVSDADLDRLAAAGVVAVLLPGCSLMSNAPYPAAQRFLVHGLRVALATNLNPGTSHTENLQLVIALAIAHMGLPVEDAWLAVTRHGAAALALEDRGVLAPGQRCDLAFWQMATYHELGYHFGVNLVERVMIGGNSSWP